MQKIKNIILFIFIFTSTIIYSQNIKLSGVFKDGDKYLRIYPDSTLEFYTENSCCLSVYMKGYGKYNLRDSVISLFTNDSVLNGNSRYEIVGNCGETKKIEFYIFDNEKNIIPGVTVTEKGLENLYLKGGITDNKGKFETNIDSCCKFVEISFIGYDFQYTIPAEKIVGKKVNIILMPYQIIRHKYVDFYIRKTKYETLIIGPYFQKEKGNGKRRFNYNLKMIIHNWPWHWRFRDKMNKPSETILRQDINKL